MWWDFFLEKKKGNIVMMYGESIPELFCIILSWYSFSSMKYIVEGFYVVFFQTDEEENNSAV